LDYRIPPVTEPGSGIILSGVGLRTVPGLNERAERAKQMLQVVNRAEAECQASAQAPPHPRANQALTRGIKFPISESRITPRLTKNYIHLLVIVLTPDKIPLS
jgi:hypothetical protein